MFRLYSFALLAVLLTGCGTINLSETNRKTIKAVNLVSKKRSPDEITYVSREQGFAAGFGLVGAAIVAVAETDRRESVENAIGALDLGGIMANELKSELQRSHLFPVTDSPSEANVTLYIHPKVAGLLLKNSLSSRLCPALAGEVSLVRRDGTVLYRKNVRTWERTRDDLAYRREEYVNDPALLNRVFRDISRKWAGEVSKSLRRR